MNLELSSEPKKGFDLDLRVTRKTRGVRVDLGRIRPPKIAEVVAARLRRQIVRSDLHEGDVLPPEGELLSQLQISRGVLREALRILEVESLLRVRRGPGGGAVVGTPRVEVAVRYFGLLLQVGRATVGDLFRARLAFEPLVAKHLASREPRPDLGTFEKILGEEKRHLDDPRTFTRVALQFHDEVLRQCGNPVLALLGAMLKTLNEEHAEFALSKYLDRRHGHDQDSGKETLRVHRAHARLVKLVRERKVAQAERHWRTHFATARYSPLGAEKTLIEVAE